MNDKNKIYNFIAENYYRCICTYNLILSTFLTKEIKDYKKIPIIINNRNRLTFLMKLIESLHLRGYENIIILDNASTYKPLLEFYKSTKIRVIYLNENLGYNALEKITLYDKIRLNYYVYTDPDVLPIEECPENFLEYFIEVLKKYPRVQKVGFALKIDDLPDYFNKKHEVISWESKFYKNEIEKNLFDAPIDTTFALHRPFARISTEGRFKMIRTGYPYVAKHLPWYNDSKNFSDEERFYLDNVEIGTHWSKGIEVEGFPFHTRILNKIKKKLKIGLQ